MKIRTFLIIALILPAFSALLAQNTVYLSWEDVVGKTLDNNLALKSKKLEVKSADYDYLLGVSSFIPTVEYQGVYTNNTEIPTTVIDFGGQVMSIKMGQEYNINHSLTATLPLFTGGARIFNLGLQKNLYKSVKEELEGLKEETALQALQAYFGIMLAEEVVEVNTEAVAVAKANLDQVQKFYDAGTSTELDLQRAKAQYSARLPELETAVNNRIMAYQNLKYILNIPLEDSLVVEDSLRQFSFLENYEGMELAGLKQLAKEYRSDLKALEYQSKAVGQQKNLVISSFLPTVALQGSITQQAQTNDLDNYDYYRGKSITLVAQWELFSGGSRFLDYQKAAIQKDMMEIAQKQAGDGVRLDVEQSWYSYNQSVRTLSSLEDAMEQARESQRLANLLYAEGMSSQVDVLNAQLLYTQSNLAYLQGIYNYNVSQLGLLKSVGRLDNIWN